MNKYKIILFFILLLIANISFADGGGDGNIDTGGGNMGDSTGNHVWHKGDDGVRITIIKDGNPIKTMDFSNKSQKDVNTYFGKVSKLKYKNGQSIIPIKGNYERYKFSEDMPTIITSNGTTNLNTIKRFFCNEGAAKEIANLANIDYRHLVNDDFKLLIEPIAYFTYNKRKYAMTATEAALYNKLAKNDLRKKMGSLTSKNLPLSMFLEKADLGISKHTGSTTTHQDDDVIIDRLGCGIVTFKENVVPEPGTHEKRYHINTWVFTSFIVKSSEECNPDDPAYVTIKVNNQIVTKVVYMPAGEEQLVWIKWKTPGEMCNIDCKVNVSGNDGARINGKRNFTERISIGKLIESTPPDTFIKDPSTGKPVRKPVEFEHIEPLEFLKSIDAPIKFKNSWSIWRPSWHENIVYYPVGDGTYQPVDEGWYIFTKKHFNAKMEPETILKAHSTCPTPLKEGKQMKSGYGTWLEVHLNTVSNSNEITAAQNALAYFPEFNFEKYDRILELDEINNSYSKFIYKKNKYSITGQNIHYTPIWFPDAEGYCDYYTNNYYIITESFDCWTPAGELKTYSWDSIAIVGNLQSDYRTVPAAIED